MDDLDRKILALLAKNARMPVKEIAEKVALTSPAVSSRIHKLETMIRKAKIVQEEDVKGDVVNVGLKVTVKDLDTGEKETFAIVGATESDPFNGKISTDSSVGKTLIGHKQGDKVVVEIPDGFINYEILEISK